jgi:hypothetical protein
MDFMLRIFVAIFSVIIAVLVFLSEDAQAHPAWGIVVDNQAQVFVSDLETIWKIDARGRQSVFRAGVSGRHIHELAIDENGNVYGEDLTYEPETQRYITAIWKMTPAGVFTYILAPTSNPPKGISIWKDRNGNTYSLQWNNSSEREVLLLKRTPDGNVSALIGREQSGSKFRQVILSSIGGMAFGTDGSLYLTDRTSVQKVNLAGTVTMIARKIAAESSANQSTQSSNTSLSGIAVDAANNIYAADFGNRRVLKITPNGDTTSLLRAEESWSPTGVAFRNGDLYILETGNASQRPRVRKLSSDGTVSVLAIIGESTPAIERETPAGENSGPVAAPKRATTYLLIGLCAAALALSLAIWQIRKKRVVKLSERKT